jgi:predicted esterase
VKSKIITTIALIVSVILNAVGAIFFFSYMNLLGHSKTKSMEMKQMASDLTYAQTANIVSEVATPNQVDKRAFISHFDHEEDFMAVEPVALPTRTRDATLFVFLHGMGQTCMEPFTYPKGAPFSDALITNDHSYVLMAPNYRSPAGWVKDAALSDITQNIRMMCQQYPVKHIVLIGSSMGGCVSLSYAALAPKDIKDKLEGLVCIEGAGNFADLYHTTTNNAVRVTLEQCFGGPPERVSMGYAGKSMLSNLTSFPGKLRVAIISARQDKTVPPALQDEVYNTMRAQGRTVTVIPVEMDHGWPPLPTVMKAVDYVLEQPKDDDGRK